MIDTNTEETLNTLNYANHARNIQKKAVINRDPVAAQMQRMRNRIEQLQSELVFYRGDSSVSFEELQGAMFRETGKSSSSKCKGQQKKLASDNGNKTMAIPRLVPHVISLKQMIHPGMVSSKDQATAHYGGVTGLKTTEDGMYHLSAASELGFDILGYKLSATEVIGPACIDKVALSENKSSQGGSYSNDCGHVSDLSSNPEVPQEANIIISGFEPGSCKFSVEEVEQLKAEKENLEREFSRCSQDVEIAKSQLTEMENQLSEVNSELASSRNMNSLAETQLKCMAESYKTLEKRAAELEGELNILRNKMEYLNIQLETERTSCQEALARCKDLEEQLQRNEECSVCSTSAAEVDIKAKQEKELEAATQQLAACQETIYLLGKQLKSMRPQTELTSSPKSDRSSKQAHSKNGSTTTGMDQVEADTATSPATLQRVGCNSPFDLYNTPYSPSDVEGNIRRSPASSRNQRHRPTKSASSTGSSTSTPEKRSRGGFTRFFSSKEKNINKA